MEQNIKYSIIIPHKNSPDLLKRCLESIPDRTDIQVVVVDDNSSSAIIDWNLERANFKGNVELVLTEEGLGAGFARNIGLTYIKGEWVLFADADDYYQPQAFDVLDKQLTEKYDILYFNIASNVIGKTCRADGINRCYEKALVDDKFVRFGCWMPWNKVISYELIKEYGLLFDEIPVGNDAMFNLKASLYAKKYKIILDKLYVLTENQNSITYKPMTFERKMLYLKINCKINRFMMSCGCFDLCLHLLGCRPLKEIIHAYGWKETIIYLFYIHSNFGLLNAVRRWMLQIKIR